MLDDPRLETLPFTFTVFTPTFNRAHTLMRVYESLQRQIYRDFEWLIVDDGSTDDTRDIVQGWQREADFPIRYYFQPNQGKHCAINAGVSKAQGVLFLPIDSDDACVPNALERLWFHWDSIPARRRERFSAVSALCVDEKGRLIGSRFPRDVLDSDSIETFHRFRIRGDKWGFQRTDVLKKFPFPQVAGERFVTEAIVWRAIARQYLTRYVNEPLLVVHRRQGADQSDHLSHIRVQHQAEGMRLFCLSILQNDLGWFAASPLEFVRFASNYARCSFHKGRGLKAQFAALKGFAPCLIWLACVPIGYGLYLRDAYRD